MKAMDHGGGVYTVHLDDGQAYGVNTRLDDPAPTHRELAEMIRSGGIAIEAAPERDPEPVRTHWLARIDRAAGRLSGPPPSETERMKAEEARDVLDQADANGDGTRDPAEVAALCALSDAEIGQRWPLLTAGLGIDGPDIVAIAEKVSGKANAARARLARVETARLTARSAVKAATTAEEIETAAGIALRIIEGMA